MPRKTRYDDLPKRAQVVIANAVTAAEQPPTREVYDQLVAAGATEKKLGSLACLRQHIVRRRDAHAATAKQTPKSTPRAQVGLVPKKQPVPQKQPVALQRTEEHRVTERVELEPDWIEVAPDGTLRTRDAEVAVRLSRALMRAM